MQYSRIQVLWLPNRILYIFQRWTCESNPYYTSSLDMTQKLLWRWWWCHWSSQLTGCWLMSKKKRRWCKCGKSGGQRQNNASKHTYQSGKTKKHTAERCRMQWRRKTGKSSASKRQWLKEKYASCSWWLLKRRFHSVDIPRQNIPSSSLLFLPRWPWASKQSRRKKKKGDQGKPRGQLTKKTPVSAVRLPKNSAIPVPIPAPMFVRWNGAH